MTYATLSPVDPHPRMHRPILDTTMAYVDTGRGEPVVFLHGNPTSSYLWRNVMPHVMQQARCLAPDLVGMGASGKNPHSTYRFVDHARYLDAWFDTVLPTEKLNLVLHDWGSGLGFYWAHRHPERVRSITYMEALVCPISWQDWPEPARPIFQSLRSPAGEKIVLEKNTFVERILPSGILRKLGEEEMTAYRQPFTQPGDSRLPTLTWPREIPLDGQPNDVHQIVSSYASWLATSPIPKLFINGNPGSLLIGAPREFCRSWANQREVTVGGSHFLQEDSPHEIGDAIAAFLRGPVS